MFLYGTQMCKMENKPVLITLNNLKVLFHIKQEFLTPQKNNMVGKMFISSIYSLLLICFFLCEDCFLRYRRLGTLHL